MKFYENNLAKIQELQPFCHDAAKKWIDECSRLNLEFKITEAYRSQERQNQLYAKGRTTPGPVVTWTLHSTHYNRTAVDILLLNCSFGQIEEVANSFGIYRPPELLKLGDLGHFQFDKAKQPPVRTPKAIIRGLQRLIAQAKTEIVRKQLQARLERFQAQHGKPLL